MIVRSASLGVARGALRAVAAFQPPALSRAIRTPRFDEGGLDIEFPPLKSEQKTPTPESQSAADWREAEFLRSGVKEQWIPEEIDGDADIPNYDRYLMDKDKTLHDMKMYTPDDSSQLTDRQEWMLEALKTQRLRDATHSAQWKNVTHDWCDDHEFPKWWLHEDDLEHPDTIKLMDANDAGGRVFTGESGVGVSPNTDLGFWGVTKEGIRYSGDTQMTFPDRVRDELWIKDKSVPEMWKPDRFLPPREQYMRVYFTQARRSKTTAKGRIASYTCLCVAGNQKGSSGFGIGKSGEPADARQKAIERAEQNMISIPLHRGRGLFRATEATMNSYTLKIWPRPEGYGLVADPFMTLILESFGIKDATIKNIGHRNPFVAVQTAYVALSKLADSAIHDVAHDTGRRVVDIVPDIDGKTYMMPQGFDSRQRGRAEDILREFQEKHMVANELKKQDTDAPKQLSSAAS